MYRSSATLRICAALVSLTVCALMAAELLGLVPDRTSAVSQGRVALIESLGVACSDPAQRQDLAAIESILQQVTERNPELVTAGLRLATGDLAVDVADHAKEWSIDPKRRAWNQLQIPLNFEDREWATLELRFRAHNSLPTWLALMPTLPLVMFVAASSFLGQFWYLKRVLQHLNPSKVIPDRVRTTLDTLAEGLLVVDRDERIVMANATFAQNIGVAADVLLGQSADDLPWSDKTKSDDIDYPWVESMKTGQVCSDRRLRVQLESGVERIFQVNSAPILSDRGSNRGALATFSDVTELELRNEQLHETLSRLEHSREQIRQHNEQLRVLASFDPLTGCMNRRAFFEKLETQLRGAAADSQVSYLIVDVDHFKSVNDNHGHAVGDEVLKHVGAMLKEHFSSHGSVCRYGGEEFSVLLPDRTIAGAAELADQFRMILERTPIADLKITASMGVAEFDLKAAEPHEAVELADRALYAAKRRGRNRVVRWDEVQDDETESHESEVPSRRSELQEADEQRIPISAVSALSAALFHRDAATAEHCRRVAQLCAATGRGMLSERGRYLLEVAALLHDIGKLGIPDEVLHKPGQLTEDEWSVMRTYENIGVVILENAFPCPELVEIVRTCRLNFSGLNAPPGMPSGGEIPLAARILSIADAYDSMLQSRNYRAALSEEEAIEELRRHAGTQFDPELVEQFVASIQSLSPSRVLSGLTPRTALQLGMETEQLACALDAKDLSTLRSMAARIKQVAEENELTEIVELTEAVDMLAADDADWLELLGVSVELLDTCRVAQWASVVDDRKAMADAS